MVKAWSEILEQSKWIDAHFNLKVWPLQFFNLLSILAS